MSRECVNASYITFSNNSFFSIGASDIDSDTSVAELDIIINKALDDVLENGLDVGRMVGLLN